MKATLKIFLFLLLCGGLVFSLAASGSRALAVGQAAPLLLQSAGRSLGAFLPGAGGTYTLKEGETLSGSLVVMGGMATVEEGATVEGDGVVLGGTMTIDGVVEGNLVILGGLVSLGETAVIEGDASVISGHIDQADGAQIEGSIIDELDLPFVLPATTPGQFNGPQWNLQAPFAGPLMGGLGLLWEGLWLLLRSFLWAVVAILVALFVPTPLERVARAATSEPWVTGGLGLLTAIAVPVILGVLAITLICLPISFVGVLLLGLAWAFGMIVLGAEVGKRMAQMVHREWALPVSAALGVFVLTLVINLVGAVVPCVGWAVPALVGMWGMGAVLVTRFGTRDYPAGAPAFVAEPLAPLEPPEQ
jgi:hypothetical protein